MRQDIMVEENQNKSKLVTGMIIGGAIGACITLLDKNTRETVATKAVDLKDTSKNVFTHVKENPNEVKDQIMEQVKQATDTLKNTMQEAKQLIERINSDVVINAKEISSDAVSFAEDAKEELRDIQTNMKDTGSKLIETSQEQETQSNNQMNKQFN
ncbi:YtxH domain-containing protein [Metabacillus sediminilitoris]|jgi:gas vesicle protein|uniref:YtxH domain-containing protein n=1 Tax=Metabacillus sediminilitoris TaxID=2567941 RepID=A0A4S4BRG1_9BACI|nr:YtxH domain-containing protein [Metabacillus sediminilitoris]QGQ46437.1 hypothetical protein GMB29_15130 [Metabacillus sediminilitoris]THF77423.1 YtxH domain-containing protein [Metabacillus sediminilitoris]